MNYYSLGAAIPNAPAERSHRFRQFRLDYIDWRMTVHGSIRRSHIVDACGVSVPQASIDLTAFQRAYPDALDYDKSARQYIAAVPPYRSRRGWTPEAVAAMAALAKTHPMGWA